MAQLEIEISGNIPDGTYKTQLIRDSDDTIQFAGLLSYVDGKATATLSTATNGDLITGIVRDGLTPTVQCAGIEGLAIEVRYFINLDPVASAYYQLDTPIVLSGDFSLDYATSVTGTAMNFADGYGIDVTGNFVAPTSVTDVLLNGVSVGIGGVAALDGKLNTVTFVGADSESVTRLGQNGSGVNCFDGIIANVSFNNAGTTTTFKLNQATANYELAQESVFGLELWDNTPALGTQWVDEGSGVYSYDGDGDFNQMVEVGIFEIGKQYLVSFEVSAISGEVKASTGVFNLGILSDVGVYGYAFTAEEDRLYFTRNSGIASCTIFNISAKEIQGNHLTYVNIAQDEREEYQLSTDGTQWDNISLEPQQLPAIIEVA